LSDRKKTGKNKEFYTSFWELDGDIKKEKQKARELRHTPWWKKKISSGVCYYCGRIFKPPELTMDHKIPLSRGGKSEKNNLVPACKDCNNRKKYLLPSEWDEYLKGFKTAESE